MGPVMVEPSQTAFDGLAGGYDDVAESALGRELRARVHAIVESRLQAGDRILDLGCGTGLDAAHLRSIDMVVTAVDASAAMLDVAKRRLAETEGPPVEVLLVDVNRPEMFAKLVGRSFDHVLVNFGVVNCVADLPGFLLALQNTLGTGGSIAIVSMGRFCPWEIGAGLSRLRWRAATRRWRPTVYEGAEIQYPTWRTFREALPTGLQVTERRALGWVLPTFEQRQLLENRPRLLRSLAAVDRLGASVAARVGCGDHWVAALERSENSATVRA
jgi:ubiquinone/menaquinone biosynthesis C-methylase UbiE